ncbi:hypothetical protein B0A48_16495 [Cryoendolithus antarcticus]|uniref:Uncharacterized protein n=1 Tax=Cryoendolithus antarcticus TaxID=1507870 RepID=A0A1V8SFL1_9PEZI|nr:hypothetical protein B0A48_16495 [Cryoendolithus antarcticus]
MPIVTRRTHRQHHYHSNGRDYLASLLDWPAGSVLEDFLRSNSVLPHLRHWLRLCYETPHRFQEAVEWINTGPKGYYYNSGDLEEDLLLECLGHGASEGEAMEVERWSEEAAETGAWITQELWARTIWRVVRDSSQPGKWLEGRREVEAYGFVSEVLCIAFHSLAFRGKESCYWGIIVGESRNQQAEWNNGREAWEQRFGEPFPAAEDEEVMDVESEVTGSEVGSEGMAKTVSELSGHSAEVDEPETSGTNAPLHEAAVTELPPPFNPAASIEVWRNGVEELTPGLTEFDDLAAILNQPDDDSERTVPREPITPVSVGKIRRGIKRPDLDARGNGRATPQSLVVGGRVLRARK